MTPEHAHELGKLAADQMLTDGMHPVSDGSIDGIVRDLESAAVHHAPTDGAQAFRALFLRGSADHFRDIASAIDAHAAALEVSR